MAFDADGNLYISDSARCAVIRKIAAGTGIITTIAGNGRRTGSAATAFRPRRAELGVPLRSGRGLRRTTSTSRETNYRVRTGQPHDGHHFDGRGQRQRPAIRGDGSPATDAAGLSVRRMPWRWMPHGNLYIARRRQQHRCEWWTRRAAAISTVAIAGTQRLRYSGDGRAGHLATLDQPGTGLALGRPAATCISSTRAIASGLVSGCAHHRYHHDGRRGHWPPTGDSGDGIPAAGSAAGRPVQDLRLGLPPATSCSVSEHRVRHISSDVAPATATQPGDQSVLVSDYGDFHGAITGVPQPATVWQCSSDGGAHFIDLVEAAPYSGVATPTLTITGTPFSLNGYLYRIRATNIWGEAWSGPGNPDGYEADARHHVGQPCHDSAGHGARGHTAQRERRVWPVPSYTTRPPGRPWLTGRRTVC